MNKAQLVRSIVTSASALALAAAGAVAVAPSATAADGTGARPGLQRCQVNFHGRIGYKLCGTAESWVYYYAGPSKGTTEHFVIGDLDHAVYHAWIDAGGKVTGWVSMGGYATNGTSAAFDTRGNVAVGVIGRDGHKWCDRKPVGKPWSGWQPC